MWLLKKTLRTNLISSELYWTLRPDDPGARGSASPTLLSDDVGDAGGSTDTVLRTARELPATGFDGTVMGTSGSLESNTCTHGGPAEELATSGSSESNTSTTLDSTDGTAPHEGPEEELATSGTTLDSSDGTAEHETWGFGDAMLVVKCCLPTGVRKRAQLQGTQKMTD